MMGSTNKLLTQLRQEIEDYDNIPVGFAQIRMKNDKFNAFSAKLGELTEKHSQVSEDISLKMK